MANEVNTVPAPQLSKLTEEEIFYSDSEEDVEGTCDTHDISTLDLDHSQALNLTSESAYEGDISISATNTLLERKPKRKMKHKVAPILRTSYYGRKRMMIGKGHFVSSAIESSAGDTLGSLSRKILFYSLMVSPKKPTTKKKVLNPIRADVICDTGASVSLAPLSIMQTLKMRIDMSHLISIRAADGKKLSSMGTSFIYMNASASPSWRRVKMVVTKTEENFLLSHADLKNLDLLAVDFPEHLGERRRAYIQAVQRENKLVSCSDTIENGCFTSSFDGSKGIKIDEADIRVNQCESSITIEYPEDLSNHQITEVEAYAALYALSGYTYNNVVQEASDKQCNSVNEGEGNTDNNSEGEDGIAEPDPKADKEALINQKSPYKQKFIREHRSLFSKSLKPS